jgi:hypothetical protein
MLLYLVKYSRPAVKAVGELSKCMDKAMYETYQEMLCAVKIALDTRKNCFKIQPNFTGN